MGKEKRLDNKDAYKSLNRKCINNKFKGSRTVLSQLSSSKKLVVRSENQHSNDRNGSKMMKDHCMETDFCILRRYIKTRNQKMSKRKVMKTRSSYATHKEVVTDSSEKTSNSACGDSKITPLTIHNVDEFNTKMARVVTKNLNKLLRNWIKNYLFNNDDTKRKIEIILDSILKKLEAKNDYVSTSSTYTIDIRINESNTKPISVKSVSTTSQSMETKSNSSPENTPGCKAFSSITVPNPGNNSLISTLNIPRYVHACHHQTTGKSLSYSLSKIKRPYNRKILLTISRSNGILSNSSSLDFLEMSTKSLTKHFATYRDKNMLRRNFKKRRIIFIPSSYCKFPDSTSVSHTNEEIFNTERVQKENETNLPLDAMPSLVKSIFIDEFSNLDSTDECSSLDRKDINTMTEESNVKKYDENMKELCENYTNMTPNLTINAAAGNESMSIVFPRPNLSLKHFTLSCANYNSKERVIKCTCKNSTVIRSVSCKACVNSGYNKDCHHPLVNIDFLNKKCNNCCKPLSGGTNKQAVGVKKSAIIHKINSLKKLFAKNQKKCCEGSNKSQSQINYEKIRHKHFRYKHKKSNSHLQKNDFLDHFQDVFNYFANYEGKRNINLDICINVYPTIETSKRNETICKQICSTYDVRTSESEIATKDLIVNDSNSKPDDGNLKVTHVCNCEQKLISLFDNTAESKKNTESTNNADSTPRKSNESTQNLSDKITTTAELEIAQEVYQLRTIIKDLAVTAEKLVTEHLKHTQLKEDFMKSNVNQNVFVDNFVECVQSAHNDATENDVQEGTRGCKSTQLTDNVSCQNLSGFKNRKDTQNKAAADIQARLMKKSTSYNIIDSETILKVTNMTSATQTCTLNSMTDEGLTCSLPKCKSLYDISVDSNKNKLMAFYCEELIGKPESANISSSPQPIVARPESKNHAAIKKSSANISKETKTEKVADCDKCLPVTNNKSATNNLSCSSVFINVDDRVNERKIKIRARRGIGFREGSLCCLLLWIPVFVILWLLYIFIIKDKFKSKTFSLNQLSRSLDYGKNGSRLSITLSDLGF